MDPDSDDDGLGDGTELGVVEEDLHVDTDIDAGNFIPDAHPESTTSALKADTDDGGIDDGIEDVDQDGYVDTGETDPNDGSDDVMPADDDDDGVFDLIDNCPDHANADQADSDGDGVGDACEDIFSDDDGDGVEDGEDNCPDHVNPNQEDEDNDGVGDACENDPIVVSDDIPPDAGVYEEYGASGSGALFSCSMGPAPGKDGDPPILPALTILGTMLLILRRRRQSPARRQRRRDN
jgi:hypothetical protein